MKRKNLRPRLAAPVEKLNTESTAAGETQAVSSVFASNYGGDGAGIGASYWWLDY